MMFRRIAAAGPSASTSTAQNVAQRPPFPHHIAPSAVDLSGAAIALR